jgi:uncharacterized protein YbbC (DUF1343 family)
MLCGLDQLSGGGLSALRRRLRGARVGVLTHAAAVDRRGRSTLNVLEELGAEASVVFAPEHGLDGVAQAEEAVDDATAPEDGPRVRSLYGSTRESLTPNAADLEGIDVLVVDLVDVGSRYYTYVWTALLALRACAAKGVHMVVLDRPNPLSGDPELCEGKPQSEGFLSFVGLEPLPIRHGLTAGELLAHFAERDGATLGPDGALSVVPCVGWERLRTAQAWARPFSPPSPNMPSLETAMVYPGGCLFEGTNLSEGRGTTLPFQLIGAPYLTPHALAQSLAATGGIVGAQVRAASFRPSFEKHAGQTCHGVLLQITSPAFFRPVAAALTVIFHARQLAPEQFEFRSLAYEFESEIPAFDLLTGSAAAREALTGGSSVEQLLELVCPVEPAWAEQLAEAESRLARARA